MKRADTTVFKSEVYSTPVNNNVFHIKSLVIRCVISLVLAGMTLTTPDQEMRGVIQDLNGIVIFIAFFILYLLVVSIIESLALLVIDIFKGIFRFIHKTVSR